MGALLLSLGRSHGQELWPCFPLEHSVSHSPKQILTWPCLAPQVQAPSRTTRATDHALVCRLYVEGQPTVDHHNAQKLGRIRRVDRLNFAVVIEWYTFGIFARILKNRIRHGDHNLMVTVLNSKKSYVTINSHLLVSLQRKKGDVVDSYVKKGMWSTVMVTKSSSKSRSSPVESLRNLILCSLCLWLALTKRWWWTWMWGYSSLCHCHVKHMTMMLVESIENVIDHTLQGRKRTRADKNVPSVFVLRSL
jgi:hypothetical protein